MADNPDNKRRDFLQLSTISIGAVGTAAFIWPFLKSMSPAEDTLALGTTEVDVSLIEEGQSITVKWRGKPVFIRRRTEEEISAARTVDIATLPDNSSGNANKKGTDASDQNRSLDEDGEWLVMVGVCTHLGCVPLGDAGDFDGWFCPCHGSHYDTSGRIRKGPAPRNLDIPLASFSDDGIIRIG